MNNEKILSATGVGVSTASLILGLVAIFNDRLTGGIILSGASLLIFLIVFIFYFRRNQLKNILKDHAESIAAKSRLELQKIQNNLDTRLDKLTSLNETLDLSPFQEISSEKFCNQIDFNDISSIDIFAHTGAALMEPLFSYLEESEEKRNKLKQIQIRILLRNPKAEIGKRSLRINQTVERIRDYQKKGFNHLLLHFYEDLPTFRSIICTHKNNQESNRRAFLSFYYFPAINNISRKYPRALQVDESKTGTHHLLEIYRSWFNYFWGKNKSQEQQIHTIILDFDDTIVQSHDIQVEAWLDLIQEAQSRYRLKPTDFNEKIRDSLQNPDQLRKKVKTIFFLKQDAKLIFPEIFSPLDADLTDVLQQRRFELREKKVKEESHRLPLFSHFLEAIVQLADKYNLIIVSATDESMITHYLSNLRLPAKTSAQKENLYELFRYVFGKKEPTFDWNNMKRKSQLIIKIINILGIPLERMVYVGDNNGDFIASRDIGIRFVEARLFAKELQESISKETLIFSDEERLYFTDWQEFKQILEKIEATAASA